MLGSHYVEASRESKLANILRHSSVGVVLILKNNPISDQRIDQEETNLDHGISCEHRVAFPVYSLYEAVNTIDIEAPAQRSSWPLMRYRGTGVLDRRRPHSRSRRNGPRTR